MTNRKSSVKPSATRPLLAIEEKSMPIASERNITLKSARYGQPELDQVQASHQEWHRHQRHSADQNQQNVERRDGHLPKDDIAAAEIGEEQ